MEQRTIQEVIKWNQQQLAKSKVPADQERYRENIRKLQEVLDDDAS